MNKILMSCLLLWGIQAQAQSVQEKCNQGLVDQSTLCIDVILRDFQIWDNPTLGLTKHSDFENFPNLNSYVPDQNHGCADRVKTNRDYLEGAVASFDPIVSERAISILANSGVTDLPLRFGSKSNGTRGFLIEYNDDGGSAGFDWSQPVLTTNAMVGTRLDANGKPIKVADKCDNTNFDQWFNDVPGVNHTIKDVMLLSRVNNSVLTKTYQISSNSYFPLDKFHGDPKVPNFGKQAYSIWCGTDSQASNATKCNEMKTGNGFNASAPDAHNYGYTMEGTIPFAYHGGEVFTFSGDDDMWIFIDSQLVADVGGVHLPAPQTIHMDQIAAILGWDQHTEHELKFFYADRQSDGSNLTITTTLNDINVIKNSPPIIQRVFAVGGNRNDIFHIYTSTALSQATIDAINADLIPDLIYRKNGHTGNDDAIIFPVVTSIRPIQAPERFERFGVPYEIIVSSNRPNSSDSVGFNPFNTYRIQIIGTNGIATDRIYKKEVEYFFDTDPSPTKHLAPNTKGFKLNENKFTLRIEKNSLLKIDIYSVRGNHLATINNKLLPAGSHELTIPELNSGVYIIRVQDGESIQSLFYHQK